MTDLSRRMATILGFYVTAPFIGAADKKYTLYYDPPHRSDALQEWRGEFDTEDEAWAAAFTPSWASCEEIEAACARRQWLYTLKRTYLYGKRCYTCEISTALLDPEHPWRSRVISDACGDTAPAAFAEAFCRAVEAERG